MGKLTKNFIASQKKPERGQRMLKDGEVPGLYLRLTPGCRSWVLWARIAGKRKSITFGKYSFMDIDTARTHAKQLLSDISLGKDPTKAAEEEARRNVTLNEVLTKFLTVRTTMKERTKRKYRKQLEINLGDWLPLPIREITKDMVEQRHEDLVGPTRCGTSGKARANGAMQILRVLMRFASDYFDFKGGNPVERITQNRKWYYLAPRQGIVPDHRMEDWYAGVMSLESKIARDFFLLLIFTALRRTEAARIKWKDVDFAAGTLTIPESCTKNGLSHTLPMTPFVQALFKGRLPAGDGGSLAEEYVFPGRYGGYMIEPRAPKDQLRRKLGWNLIFHDLRRTFLTHGERLNVSHYVLKKIANHMNDSKDPTGKHYIVVSVDLMRPAMELITSRMLELMGTTVEKWQEHDARRGLPELAAGTSSTTFAADPSYEEDEDQYLYF